MVNILGKSSFTGNAVYTDALDRFKKNTFKLGTIHKEIGSYYAKVCNHMSGVTIYTYRISIGLVVLTNNINTICIACIPPSLFNGSKLCDG